MTDARREDVTPAQRKRILDRARREIRARLKAKTFKPVRMWAVIWKPDGYLFPTLVGLRSVLIAKLQSQRPDWQKCWKVVPVEVRRLK